VNPDKSYVEYKKRVIDPISSSFCAAKWLHSTIDLGAGKTASCHHPSPHSISLDEIETNPSAIHNTSYKKSLRKKMLDGERPEECDYCWTIEDMGTDSISDRTFKTIIYNDDIINQISKAPWDADVDLERLEIAFDRTCNFACSYCSPSHSTTWTKDIKTFGPYKNLLQSGNSYVDDGTASDATKNKNENPYIAAFWEWWPSLSKTLKELRITGGEPMMSDDVWKLMDKFGDEQIPIRLAINSNLGAKDSLIDLFIEKSHRIKNLNLYTSCEATGSQAEYIRDGMDYKKFLFNVERILVETKIKKVSMMMTINSLCLFSISEFMDDVIRLKRKYGKSRVIMDMNILRYPNFMNMNILPDEIKTERKEHLQNWLSQNLNSPFLFEMEKNGVNRIIDYLDVVVRPEKDALAKEFKSFFEQYDTRRNKKLVETFPALTEWFKSIPKIIQIKAV
jgi:organic radical activating enzyme